MFKSMNNIPEIMHDWIFNLEILHSRLSKISSRFAIEEVGNKINAPIACELFLGCCSHCSGIVCLCSVTQNYTSYEIHLVTVFIWLSN